MAFDYDSIRVLHLELTSRCNASCPQCSRNLWGGKVNPRLPMAELRLDHVKTILTPIVDQLHYVYACGNYGDPIVAHDCLEIMQWLRSKNDNLSLGLHTNGSARPVDWWKDLGRLMSRPGDHVKWGIDGLVGTNHLYRRNTDWRRIMENARGFISGGGRAHWEYIVFRHNEHEVDTARSLSISMGFEKFTTKRTARFTDPLTLGPRETQPVMDVNGKVEYHLEQPVAPEWQNPATTMQAKLVERHGSIDAYLGSCQIRCKVEEDNSIYISSEGLVFPCCWTANQLYAPYAGDEIWNIINNDVSSISAAKHGLQAIVNGGVFSKIKAGWDQGLMDGRLRTCARICGSGIDKYAGQWKDVNGE